MKIELKEISIRELFDGYVNNHENGVTGYNGKLNIRPPYQREFIYDTKQKESVIDTILKGFPLNVMYWAVCENDHYEIIDGQQRTMSICEFIAGNFSIKYNNDQLGFHNFTNDIQAKIFDYKLMIYFCTGGDSEKLEWFKTINIAGEKLTDQELRNAVYSGSWVTDAKRYFSKTNCVAQNVGGDYLNGSAIRQDYLETAIDWISKGDISGYMSKHQHDVNASALWQYFNAIMTWINSTFQPSREQKRIMKGLNWGELYDKHKDDIIDLEQFNNKIQELILDDDVTNKKGIYPYLITNDLKHLSIRGFSEAIKLNVYERQQHHCANPKCPDYGKEFELSQMEADHITPWHAGGHTVLENCQLLCRDCNRRKSGK